VAQSNLSLRVVSPAATVFEGEVESVVLTAWDGEVGILPGHAPFIALLGGGVMRAAQVGGGEFRRFLSRGVVKVEDNQVTVLSEYAGTEPPAGFTPSDAWLDLEESEGEGGTGLLGNLLG